MTEFICLFFPAFISVFILGSLQKEKFIWQDYIIAYASFVTVINFFIALILTLFFDNGYSVIESSLFINLFIVKYLFIALVLAIILPFCFEVIRKNIKITMSVTLIKKDKREVLNKENEETNI